MVAKIGDKSWIALMKLETREKEKEIDSGWIDRRSNLFERWQGKRCLFFFFSLLFDTRAKILGWGEDDLISTWTARDGYMEGNEDTVCIRSRGKSIVGLCSIRWSLSLCSAREATRACIYWHSRWMDTFVAAEVAMRDDARGEGRGEGVLRSRSTIASTCLKFPFFFFLFFWEEKVVIQQRIFLSFGFEISLPRDDERTVSEQFFSAFEIFEEKIAATFLIL